MDKIKRGERYVMLCKEAIQAYESEKASLDDAALRIRDGFPGGILHPMLNNVYDLAFDILGFSQYETEDKKNDWGEIVKNVRAYAANEWASTCLMLVAMYSRYEQEKVTEGLTLVIKRLNGTTTVESGNRALNTTIKKLAAKLNPQQTDEWFLLNLSRVLPEKADGFRLEQAGVGGDGSGILAWYPLD